MRAPDDPNAAASGALDDLAAIQTDRHKAYGYGRASSVVLALDDQLDTLRTAAGTLPKIAGIGPSSTRVIVEVLDHGQSPTVEDAVRVSGRRAEIDARRALRQRVLSRAAVRRVLSEPEPAGPSLADYRGDLQMHPDWSDGTMTLPALVAACANRGYAFAAVTDHSRGLRIARGMNSEDMARQHRAIDEINHDLRARHPHSGSPPFRLLKGIEANITPDGPIDLTSHETAAFELVLAAPHSQLRTTADQTDRLLRAIETPGVHVLAHPRGRIAGSRAGIVADWDRVFARAAELCVAVEIDGDPARQDLDYTLAARALEAGCLFALDSDAHAPDQLVYAETALAHARLARIPPARVVNCWTVDELLTWSAERRAPAP
jgi:histidinol phosphatase-like PHP family hydrolase